MKIAAVLLAALALTASARDTNRYDRVETRGGIEFSQRGGLGNSNEVVTAFDRAAFWEAAKSEPGFSNAVDAVVEDVDPSLISDGSFRIDADRSVYVLVTNEIPAVLTKWRVSAISLQPSQLYPSYSSDVKVQDLVGHEFDYCRDFPFDENYSQRQVEFDGSIDSCNKFSRLFISSHNGVYDSWHVSFYLTNPRNDYEQSYGGSKTGTGVGPNDPGSFTVRCGYSYTPFCFDMTLSRELLSPKRYETYWKFVGRLASTNDLDVMVADWARKPNVNPDTRVPGIVSNVVTSTWLPKLLMTSGDVWDGASGVRTDTILFPNSLLVTDTWALSRDVHHSTSQGVIRAELPLYVRHADIGSSSICDNMIYKKVAGVNEWAWDSALSSANVTGPSVFERDQAVSVGGTLGNLKFNGSQWGFTASYATWWQTRQYSKNSFMPFGSQKTLVNAMKEMMSSGSSNLGYGSTSRSNVPSIYEASWFHIHSSDPGSGEFISWTDQIPYDWYDNETRTLVSSVTNDLSAAKIPEDYEEVASKARAAVPNTTTVAGKPLSSNVTLGTLTIQGQTYDGTANKTIDIDGMDYEAMTNTVNAVKNLHWDEGLSVTWTNAVHNGHVYYITVTNTNVSTL